jgi:hypothetical protein
LFSFQRTKPDNSFAGSGGVSVKEHEKLDVEAEGYLIDT